MHALNSSLPEFYYISSFVSGLKEDIKLMLKILKPMALMTTFKQAKQQEKSNNVLARKNKFVPRIGVAINIGRPPCNFPIKHVNQYKNEGQHKQKNYI